MAGERDDFSSIFWIEWWEPAKENWEEETAVIGREDQGIVKGLGGWILEMLYNKNQGDVRMCILKVYASLKEAVARLELELRRSEPQRPCSVHCSMLPSWMGLIVFLIYSSLR